MAATPGSRSTEYCLGAACVSAVIAVPGVNRRQQTSAVRNPPGGPPKRWGIPSPRRPKHRGSIGRASPPWRYLALFAADRGRAVRAGVPHRRRHKPTPKLGIDLQGGTRVTLHRPDTGRQPAQPGPPEPGPPGHRAPGQRHRRRRHRGTPRRQQRGITVPGEQGEQARRARPDSAAAVPRGRRRPVQPVAPAQPAPTGAPATTPTSGAPTTPAAPTSPATPTDQAWSAAGLAAGAPAQQQSTTPPPSTRRRRRSSSAPAPRPPAERRLGRPRRPRKRSRPPRRCGRTRRWSDPARHPTAAVLQQAAPALDCAAEDPLRGYDDPTLPLVACDQDNTRKYVLGAGVPGGHRDRRGAGHQNPQGAGWVVGLTFKSAGAVDLGRLHLEERRQAGRVRARRRGRLRRRTSRPI